MVAWNGVRVGEGDTRKKLLKGTKKLLVVMDMSYHFECGDDFR